MTKHIVVGCERGSSSHAALRWAADEADLVGAPLQLVQCYEPPAGDPYLGLGCGTAVGELAGDAERSVERAAEDIRATHPHLPISVGESPMTPADALAHGRCADDLVVIGMSRHTDAAAFWLGSTARRLLRRCRCPVAFVPSPGPAVHRARRVVVGVDGSAAARAAMMWAGEEAQRHGAPLVLVHGWSYPFTGSPRGRDLSRVEAACVLEREAEAARQRFGCDVRTDLVEALPPTAVLTAADEQCLLVLGPRSRGALTNAVFGSTTTAAVEHSRAPVVVVPS